MTLAEFQRLQAKHIEETAIKLNRLLEINPNYDIETGIDNCLKNNPFLRGVSKREIKEVMLWLPSVLP